MVQRVKDWVSDFGEWLWSIIYQWQVLVTGGLITALLTGFQSYIEKSLSWGVSKWVFGAFLIIALFQSWRKKKVLADLLQMSLNTPLLTCIIDTQYDGQMDVFGKRETVIMVSGSVMNTSARATGIYNWKMSFVSGERTTQGVIASVGSQDERIPVPGVPGSTIVLYHQEFWPRNMSLVPAGGALAGWIWATFEGITPAELVGPNNRLVIEFSDVATGHMHMTTRTLDGSGRRYQA